MSDFLHRYFLNNHSKRCHKWLHYFDIYERHFDRFRGKSPTVLEIGVHGGGSLEMWKAYFGPGSRILGIDINEKCKQHESEGIEVFIGSQDDPDLIESVFQQHPKIDVVIDDGSHEIPHQIASFQLLYSRLDPSGLYLVEDVYHSYHERRGGGIGRDGTFIDMVKHKIDELNAAHTRGDLPISDFTRSTDSICCYDSVVVFERRPQGLRQAVATRAM
ncbi:MAG: class I SAM-dependent methyltransferase [Alphaproteobacteria bacterium]|nr:class I SAM-dependent methyltransferase [Alphaproteobacteria bacterium]